MITVRTSEVIDPGNNAFKYYRAFTDDSAGWTFYCSGRIGTSGQMRGASRTTGIDKLLEKESEGYGNRRTIRWQHDLPADFDGSTEACKRIAQLYSSTVAGANDPNPPPGGTPTPPPATPVPAPAPSAMDRLQDFNDRALAGISLAVTDPQAALMVFAQLNDEWPALEGQVNRARSYLSTLDQLLMGAHA